MTQKEAITFLTHVIKHLVNSQPAELSQLSMADNASLDIIIVCKAAIRAEMRLNHFRVQASQGYITVVQE